MRQRVAALLLRIWSGTTVALSVATVLTLLAAACVPPMQTTVIPQPESTIRMPAIPLGKPIVETIAGKHVLLYAPAGLRTTEPVQVLLTLHPMNGNGDVFGESLIPYADQNGWLIVAPQFVYNPNWQSSDVIAREDPEILRILDAILAGLPEETNLSIRPRVIVYGFSRGAQLAHRFALANPDQVAAVATMSAGSYTLPVTRTANGQPLLFPFGVANLEQVTGQRFDQVAFRRIAFSVQVGALDNNPNDTPHAWDDYEGTTRLERARRFSEALQRAGNVVDFTVQPDTGHTVTPAMRGRACTFLKQALQR